MQTTQNLILSIDGIQGKRRNPSSFLSWCLYTLLYSSVVLPLRPHNKLRFASVSGCNATSPASCLWRVPGSAVLSENLSSEISLTFLSLIFLSTKRFDNWNHFKGMWELISTNKIPRRQKSTIWVCSNLFLIEKRWLYSNEYY